MTAAATEAARQSWESRRARMADDLGAAAEEFLAAARQCGGRGARDYMAALSVAIDKAQLLTGEATDRRETIRPEVVEAAPLGPFDRARVCLAREYGNDAWEPGWTEDRDGAPARLELYRSVCPAHSHPLEDRPLTIRERRGPGSSLIFECEGDCLPTQVHDAFRELEAKWLGAGSIGAGDAETGDDARGETSTNGRHKLRRLDVTRMAREEPPPVPWIVEGLVARGMLTVLAGREGEGKSLLAQALAAGVATGQDEAGLPCHHGRVLIVDAENGEHEIWRRVHTLGLDPAGIEIYEAEGFDLRPDLRQLEHVLEEHRPDLLVLDSYRSLWSGKENDSGEVAGALDPLRNLVRRFQAGTLLLHHSSRATGEYRGNSAIGASAELGFKLAKADDDPERRWRRYLKTWKCRPAAEPQRRWLRLAVERGQVFVDKAEPFKSEAEAAEAPAPVQDELRPRILAVLGDEPSSRADVARAVSREPKDRSVGRVLDRLEQDGDAERTPGGWRRGVAGATAPIGGSPPCHPPRKTALQCGIGGGRGFATLDALCAPDGDSAGSPRIGAGQVYVDPSEPNERLRVLAIEDSLVTVRVEARGDSGGEESRVPLAAFGQNGLRRVA